MPIVKSKIVAAKNHLARNRGRYGFAAGLLAGSYVTVAVLEWNELFLEVVAEDALNVAAE